MPKDIYLRGALLMRRRRKNRTGVGIITFLVLILFAIISYRRIGLADELKKSEYESARLVEQIQDQKDRSKDIENMSKYTKTKEYIEDIARKKLGLVYKDEIIFKEKE